jgi:hypothetical protein
MSAIDPTVTSDASNEHEGLRSRLVIELACTDDDSAGPWPPPGDGWRALPSADRRTLWRRITLQT